MRKLKRELESRGAALIFALLIILTVGLMMGYFMKESDSNVKLAQIKKDRELLRLSALDRVVSYRSWILDCVNSQLVAGSGDSIDFDSCSPYTSAAAETYSAPTCLGQSEPWEANCTKDSRKMPKRFEFKVVVRSDSGEQIHSVRETAEIYFPSINAFALLATSHSLSNTVSMGTATFDGELGVYFSPSAEACSSRSSECASSIPVSGTDLADKSLVFEPLTGNSLFKGIVSTNIPRAQVQVVEDGTHLPVFEKGILFNSPPVDRSSLEVNFKTLINLAMSSGGVTNSLTPSSVEGSSSGSSSSSGSLGGSSSLGSGSSSALSAGDPTVTEKVSAISGSATTTTYTTKNGIQVPPEIYRNQVVSSIMEFSYSGGECTITIKEIQASTEALTTNYLQTVIVYSGPVEDGKVYLGKGKGTVIQNSTSNSAAVKVCDDRNATFLAEGRMQFKNSLARWNVTTNSDGKYAQDGDKGYWAFMARDGISTAYSDTIPLTTTTPLGSVTSNLSGTTVRIDASLISINGDVGVDPVLVQAPSSGSPISYGNLEIYGSVLTQNLLASRSVSSGGSVQGFTNVSMKYPPALGSSSVPGLDVQIGGAPLARVVSQEHQQNSLPEALSWVSSY